MIVLLCVYVVVVVVVVVVVRVFEIVSVNEKHGLIVWKKLFETLRFCLCENG